MKTGMIIVNYNDQENTIHLLEQVKEYTCLNKIVVVDNQSRPEEKEKIKQYENKKIVLLEAKENKGYASGNNIGLKYLEEQNYDLAIITNPDVRVEESVIKELIKDMTKNKDISFLGPKVLEMGTISKGWKAPTYWIDVLSTINFFQRYAKKLLKYKEEDYKERLTKVEVISGCFFIARLKDFKKIKYFDPNTFLYYEENILAKKAQTKGLNTYINHSVSIEHLESKSVDKSLNKIKKYKRLKESMFYYEKEYNHINILQLFFLKIVYFLSLIIAYLTFWI